MQYAAASNYEVDDMEKFYKETNEVMERNKKYAIIMRFQYYSRCTKNPKWTRNMAILSWRKKQQKRLHKWKQLILDEHVFEKTKTKEVDMEKFKRDHEERNRVHNFQWQTHYWHNSFEYNRPSNAKSKKANNTQKERRMFVLNKRGRVDGWND